MKVLSWSVFCAALLVASLPAVAFASPPDTLDLSSWTSTVVDGQIVGGTMTVTVSNPGMRPIDDASFELSPMPCACTIATYRMSAGTLDDRTWSVGTLAGGASETLEITYGMTEPGVVRASFEGRFHPFGWPRAV